MIDRAFMTIKALALLNLSRDQIKLIYCLLLKRPLTGKIKTLDLVIKSLIYSTAKSSQFIIIHTVLQYVKSNCGVLWGMI